LIDRYALPEIAGLFSDEARFRAWLEVEILATEAWAKLGVVPAADAVAVRERADFTVSAIHERERTTEHDVAAFVDVVQERIGAPAGSWLHYGLTSSDVVDTALSVVLVQACDLVLDAAAALEDAIRTQAHAHRAVAMAGRTHGVHAEPTTFGLVLLGFAMELRRQRRRLAEAFAGVAVGKLSGAVGTYANSDPRVEAFALGRLELQAEEVATQVIPRDRHARLLSALAEAGSSLDRFATEIRHLQRTEVREAFEPFASGQKGSSSMPHKQNPIVCERVSGLARVLRANAVVGLENVVLWHERDISHSSAERVVLPDSTIALDYMLDRVVWLAEGLAVDPERMLRNLEASYGLVFSGRALLALVEAGASREAAYQIVQRNALRAWDEETAFRALLEADPDAMALVDAAALDRVFDLESFLRHVDAIFDRTLDALEVEHV
jgi:adenylosuccinate lyase